MTDSEPQAADWPAIRWLGIFFVAAMLAGSIAGIVIERGIGLDFANFYDAGQKANAGQFTDLYDPFARIDGEKPLGNMTFFSLPAASYLFAPFAVFAPKTALVLFKIQSTAFIFASLVLVYLQTRKLAGTEPGKRAVFFAIFTGAALLFQPFWTIYRVGGQTTPLILFLFLVGLSCFMRKSNWCTAACYVLIVMIKPIFAPGLILLFLFSDNRFRVASVVLSGAAAGLSFLFLGWDVHMLFLAKLAEESAQLVIPYFNSHMFAWVDPLFLSLDDYKELSALPGGVRILTLALRVAVIGGLVFMLIEMRRGDYSQKARAHFTFVLSMMVPLILSPLVWAHYLVIFFVPLAQMLAARRFFPAATAYVILVAALFAIFQNLLLVIKIIRRIGLDSWAEVLTLTVAKSITMFLIVAAILIWRRNYLQSYNDPAWRD